MLKKTLALPLTAVLILAGCDSSVDPQIDPPAVVTPDAFSIGSDDFPDQGASKSGTAGTNFITAAATVGFVSTHVGLHLIIPSAVTHAALNAGEPTLEDNTWQWSSTVEADTTEYQFTLSAATVDDHIEWTMHVQHRDPDTGEVIKEGNLYTAETNPNSNSGTWELFYEIDGVVENVLDASFEVESETKKEITFTAAYGEEEGSTVTYATDGDLRTFTVVRANGETHLVTWNKATHEGSITSPHTENVKVCWDTELANAECPAA